MRKKPPRRDERRRQRDQKRYPPPWMAMAVSQFDSSTGNHIENQFHNENANFLTATDEKVPSKVPSILFVSAEIGVSITCSDMEQDDDEIDLMPVTQRTVNATLATPLHPAGPCEVFQLDACPIQWLPEPDRRPIVGRRIEREIGITRCITYPYADTVEAIEAEQARRARQRPPRPTARYLKVGNAARPAKQTARFHAAPVYA
ncbi:hypothetical protein [Rhodoferax fermentans]|uniref:Uncharacterized protein n=1 Tax=Rhodoferax fermentans TaxID=28066 RepID=A0A1T1ANM4_RHOFE|nr:hypothetical protein [Rhodoferax fermentans]MBK1685530.1 hypothetical protein [Rhodoferax fermentans]OOV05654.1 hypothetical protein RF819_02050 [Rhodoferax fermentans]